MALSCKEAERMTFERVLRCIALLLVFSMLSQSMAFAKKHPDGPAIREKVAAVGEGHQCRLKLADGTQVKGVIVNIHADNLTLKTKDVDQPRQIDYAQITGVHNAETSDTKTALTIIGVTAGVCAGVLIWLMYELVH